MRDCMNGEVRDRLPDLLHDRLPIAERAAVLAHVGGCAECSAELSLLRELRGALAVAPPVDLSRIVAAVRSHPERGRNAADEGPGVPAERPDSRIVPIDTARRRREARARASGGRWRVAAAIATLMVGGTSVGILARQRGADDGTPVRRAAESTSLGTAAAPASVGAGRVGATASPADGTPAAPAQVAARSGDVDQVGGGLLADATDAELRALIEEIEQFDGTPVAEPEPVTPVVGVSGTNGRSGGA